LLLHASQSQDRTYTLTYEAGRLVKVTDPPAFPNQNQQFVYIDMSNYDGTWVTDYLDRRGERWRVTFSLDSGNLLAIENPVNHASNFGYATSPAQLVHEKTSTTRGGQVWTTAYNDFGDVTDATDPMHHKTHFDY